MTLSNEQLIHSLGQLKTQEARKALAHLDYRFTKDQIDMMKILVEFVKGVELIQKQVVKQVPVLFKEKS